MSVKKVSIIIVTYNNMDVIDECIQSIYEYNDIGELLEVIIVDNSDNDILYNFINDNYKNVRIIKSDNRGFGFGNNIGFENSCGEYLLFLNPDTKLIMPLFEYVIRKFENNDKLGLFGVKLLNKNLKSNLSFYLIDSAGFTYSILTKISNFFNIFIDGKMFTSGANLFVKRKVFLNSGLFDEAMFLYYEESDLIKRIRRLGYVTSFFPEKSIIHLEGNSAGESDFSLKERLKSAEYYYDKYDIDFREILKKEIKYDKLKLGLMKMKKNKNEVEVISDKIMIKENFLNE